MKHRFIPRRNHGRQAAFDKLMKTNIKSKLELFLIIMFTLPAICSSLCAAESPDSGLNAGLANLYQISAAESRSISPENFTGEKGKAGMATNGTGGHASSELGQSWKVSPSVGIKAGAYFHVS